MLRELTIATLFLSLSCVSIQANPPRGIADLEPAKTLEERKEQMAAHALNPATQTTTTVRSGRHGSSVSKSTDLSLLAQDGNYYHLHDYLGELHKVGIAKDVDNPLDHYGNLRMPMALMYGGITTGPWLGIFLAPAFEADCGNRPSDHGSDDYTARQDCDRGNDFSFVKGMTAGLVLGLVVSSAGGVMYGLNFMPIAAAKKTAARERAAWSRQWNQKLMKKLSLKVVPSVTKGQ